MAKAAAIWYRYKDSFPGDIIHQSVCVPADGATLDTYYCCLQWNAGMLGGGYCGIQDHPEGMAFIYSLWDPKGATKPITAVYVGERTQISRFTDEGTGLHAMNFSIGWKPDNWYSLVSRVWPYKDHTYYGFWIHGETERTWNHIVTMDFPYSDVQFNTESGSFVEDWAQTGSNTRRAFYRHGYKRHTEGWYPYSVATFKVNEGPKSAKHANNYDAGTVDDYYYLATGGTIKPTPGIGKSHTFHLSMPSEPQEPSIDFTITKATTTMVEWNVPASSTPQFKFTVAVTSQQPISDVQPEARSQVLTGGQPGDVVTVTLEDILGRSAVKSLKITQDYCCCSPPNSSLNCTVS